MTSDNDLLLKQILDAVKVNNSEIKTLKNEMNKRFDLIEEKLEQIEEGQQLLNDRLFKTEKDVKSLKRVK